MNNQKKEKPKFVWGQGCSPSQDLINKYEEKRIKYEKWLENYRNTHNGAEPPPPKFGLPVIVIEEDDVEENSSKLKCKK